MTRVASGLPAFQRLLPLRGDIVALDCSGSDLATLREPGRAIAVHDRCSRAASVSADGGVIARRYAAAAPLPYPSGIFAGGWVVVRAENSSPEKLIREVARVSDDRAPVMVRIADNTASADLVAAEFRALGFELQDFGHGSLLAMPREETRGRARSSADADCLFCPAQRFVMNDVAGLPGAASVLWGDDELFAIPDLAPLVPGHLLLVAVTHRLAFDGSAPPLTAALERAKARVNTVYERIYGSRAIFLEHGPGLPGTGGACIDHAHLHCLPARKIEGISASIRAGAGAELPCGARGPYLYVEADGQTSRFADTVGLSQFLRRAALDVLGETRPYRWQESFASQDNQSRYLDTLRTLLGCFDE